MRVLLVIFISFNLFGATKSGELISGYRGLRPLGMGGAFIAVANDYNALFYNPAGLNSVEKWKLEVVTLGFGISSQIKNLYENSSRLGGNVQQIVQVVGESIGKNHHVGIEFVPSWVRKNFGVALVEDMKLNIRIRNQAVPEIDVNVKNDVNPVVGLAGRFWNRYQLGFAIKGVYRFHSDNALGAIDVLNSQIEINDIIKEGYGFGLDLGMNYILPFKYSQKVGLQIADFLNTTYNSTMEFVKEAGRPKKTKMTFNAGYKINLPELLMFRPVVAIDFRDIFNVNDSSYVKRLHLGTEIKLPYIFTVRAGLSQGLSYKYFTFGASADLWLVTLDFVSFVEELGVGHQNPDRRYYIRLSLGV